MNKLLRFCKQSSYYSSYSDLGSVKVNSVPTPCVLTTVIFSLCAVIISFTMERPNPVPFLSLPRKRSVL